LPLIDSMTKNIKQAPEELCKGRLEMIEAGGRLCQLLGMPRSIGQIYGLLFFSAEPLSLDEITSLLGISKASASTGTRMLVTWMAIRPVWIPGDRRDYFEVLANFVRPRIVSSGKRLGSLATTLAEDQATGRLTPEEYEICSRRLGNLSRVQARLDRFAPLAEKLL
jgi:HTH-type transcriptional regulator, glycine betaine synthesis regulator